jgi:SAM-dependent methyltransferase
VPQGARLNYAFQRHVTRGLPVSDAKLARRVARAQEHLDALAAAGVGPGDGRFFEFGSGWDLAMPLALHGLGVTDQLLVDIRPLARAKLVDDMARRLPGSLPARHGRPLVEHLADLGITYRAPCDAAATGLPDGSIHAVTSTNTLEHIPATDIARILAECRRILAPGGAMSFVIDYEDHYAKFDPSIDVFHFLAHDERSWRRFNPDLHHQNRLRHHQYLALFEAAGFEVVSDRPRWPGAEAVAALDPSDLADPWRTMTVDQLAITGSHVVLR